MVLPFLVSVQATSMEYVWPQMTKKSMPSSEQECQCKQVLCLDHGMQLHKNLLIALQSYLSDIRSQLPCPILFQASQE